MPGETGIPERIGLRRSGGMKRQRGVTREACRKSMMDDVPARHARSVGDVRGAQNGNDAHHARNNEGMRLTTNNGTRRSARIGTAIALASLIGLGGCGMFSGGDSNYPSQEGTGPTNPNPTGQRQTIFGSDGITLFGGGDDKNSAGTGIGINSFLWRASLDTISFMPLASADPFGGVIITDWYQDPKTPNERFKLTVYIMDRRLRADGVKVAVFRQTRDEKGGWDDAAADPQTGPKIENAILVRARQLRISTTEAGDNK